MVFTPTPDEEQQPVVGRFPVYCWCGHERSTLLGGHRITADGVGVCDGICAPNPPDRSCKCANFVPAVVASFRMIDAVHGQILDFKMLVAQLSGVVKVERNDNNKPRLFTPN